MTWRIGVDTGGTFTDVVAYNAGKGSWIEKKIWSQRADPGASLKAALDSLKVPLTDVESVVYGTTVVTNALIQGAVGRVALICTKGFRDVLHIARQRRDVNFGLKAQHRDAPPVPRELCFELDERCDAHGQVTRRVDSRDVTALLERINGHADAIAVSFLHSYLNDANEETVAQIARETQKYVLASHEASPEAREYERTLVTVLNASLLPMMSQFLGSLLEAGVPKRQLQLFHSSGGMVSPETASRFPMLLAMSGPAAGVEAASAVANALRLPYAISFDMGGTTTDCSLIVDGRAEMQMEGHIGRHRVRQPMVAVESIGAGGGSIVRLTDTGLHIGPDSAGADPGPACYKRGGKLPTITDAAAILGYFGSGAGVERPISIDRDAAAQAYASIANRLALTIEEAALGALRVGSAVAARAIKRISMGRGVDARSCALLAFGGAGPMVACQLAAELGIKTVVVPNRSSALSAIGCLAANPSFTRQRTVRIKEGDFKTENVKKILAELEQVVLDELLGQDAGRKHAEVTHSALMRYAGQSYEIDIPLSANPAREELTRAFRKKHFDTYSFAPDEPWECLAIRSTATGESQGGKLVQGEVGKGRSKPLGTSRAYFSERGWCNALEYQRVHIGKSDLVAGPAILVDEFSTILVPPNWSARGEDGGHIHIEFRGN